MWFTVGNVRIHLGLMEMRAPRLVEQTPQYTNFFDQSHQNATYLLYVSDEELKKNIDICAEYFARGGVEWEANAKRSQSGNWKYAFLWGMSPK